MNKLRRKELDSVVIDLSAIEERNDLYCCIGTLENIMSDEQDYYDNIPDNLKYSYRAESSERAIECLDDALDYMNGAYDVYDTKDTTTLIHKAIEKIEEAKW
jgi:hypothetical protein